MALNSSGITAAIAALNVTGVTIKDIDAIPQSVINRDCPIFFPMPGDWLDGGRATSEDETTFGPAGSRLWHVYRTYKYVFLHSAVGIGRGNSDTYQDAQEKIEALTTAITALDVSGVDVTEIKNSALGVLQDAAGSKFTGCTFNISIRERINP